jgi:erythromycin esterase
MSNDFKKMACAGPMPLPSPDVADGEAGARRAIEAEYARIGAAITMGDLEAVRAIYAPEFTELTISGEERDLSRMMIVMTHGLDDVIDLKVLVEIDAIESGRDEATVVARIVYAYTRRWPHQPDSQAISVLDEETRHDTWVKSTDDWRLRRSETHRSRNWADGDLVDEQTLVRSPSTQERAAIVRELGIGAHPFNTVLPGRGIDDLEFLDQIIGDARLVALGEANHGTAEFFLMKHRLLEYLVERKGFSVLAMESPWPEGRATDCFIRTGEADLSAALGGTFFPIWRTAEVRAMLEWMRTRNARHGDQPVLSFAGFDMQFTGTAVQLVLNYASRLDEADRNRIKQLYDGIEKLDKKWGAEVSAPEKLRLKDNAAKALEFIEARFTELPDILTAEECRDARHAARIVLQACEMHAAAGFGPLAVRDRAMAENVRWLLEERFPGEKIVLWCHNDHVGTVSYSGVQSQGMHLRERYGARMVVLGFASHHGEVRARRIQVGTFLPGPPVALPIPAASPASVEAIFDDAGLPRFILDLRRVSADGVLGRWLANPVPHRSIGSGFDPDAGDFSRSVLLPAKYDGIIFIAESNATKPVE